MNYIKISVHRTVRPSMHPSTRPSVPCYFQTTKNVMSRVPMMPKFYMVEKKDEDHSTSLTEFRHQMRSGNLLVYLSLNCPLNGIVLSS